MKILVLEPNKGFKVREIEGELKDYQEIVGGYIEAVPTRNDNILMICNEEGKLEGLEPNFKMGNDIVVGSVLFVGRGGEDFRELTDEEITEVKGWFGY